MISLEVDHPSIWAVKTRRANVKSFYISRSLIRLVVALRS
jgi:hypothetical protein